MILRSVLQTPNPMPFSVLFGSFAATEEYDADEALCMCKFCTQLAVFLVKSKALLNLMNGLPPQFPSQRGIESFDITNVLRGPHNSSCPCATVFVSPPALPSD